MKRSAGILLYKKEENEIFALLAHFGGPYWQNKDIGGWSLQKGIVEDGEKIVTSARREVREETNLQIPEEIRYLASKKVSKHKLVVMFYTYFDGDLSSFKSSTFQKEWPKNSGQMKEFPEMDQIRWFSLRDAKKYIHPTQRFFLERLEEKLQV